MVQEESGSRTPTPTVLDLDGDTLDMLKVIEPGRGRGTPHRLADRPMDADLAAALMSAELEFTSDHNGGATVNLGRNLAAAVVGPTDRLADLFPDVPPTMTDRNQSVVIVSLPDCDAVATDVMVPDDQGDADIEQVHVIAHLAEGVTVITGDGNNITVPAGTVMGPVYDGDDDRPAVAAMCETLTAALTAALPGARNVAVTRVETARRARENSHLPEHIRADRDAERKQAEVAADRAARTGETTTTVTAEGRALLAGELDLSAVLRGGVKRERPTVYPVSGDRFLFYAGKTHTVFGPGGTGKSTLGQAACMAVLKHDPTAEVLYLDYEDTGQGVGVRLVAMGLTAEDAARFHYLPSPSQVTLETLRSGNYALVVLDGVEGALSAHGAGMNDYKRWHDSVVLPLAAETGAAVVLLDHPAHGTDRPIGSVFKINALTGAAYRLDNRGRLFLAGTDGKAKDRPRGLDDLTGPGDLLARVDLAEDGDDMAVTVTMYPDMDATDRTAAEDAPGGRLDKWLAETGAELSRGEVVAVVIALEDKRVAPDKVPGLVRKYAPNGYKAGRKKAWETEAVNAARDAGYIVHPSARATKTWVTGTLSAPAAAAVAALSEDPEN